MAAQLVLDVERRVRPVDWLFHVAFLCFVLAANCAHAQCPGSPVALQHEGADGVWFPLETSRCLLANELGFEHQLPLLRQRVTLLDESLTLRDQQRALLKESLALAIEAEHRALSAVESAERLRRRAEEALRAWWRSPELWIVVGLLCGFGAAIVGARVARAGP